MLKHQAIQKGWLILIPLALIVCLLWLTPGLQIPPVLVITGGSIIEERAQTLYLLSAIAQSLAAILALVFTISLIIAQLSSKYSNRILVSVFDLTTVLYITLFIISIFLPLWLLIRPNTVAIKLSISLTAACLLLLIPYFLKFREKLNPEHTIKELTDLARKRIKVQLKEEPEEFVSIDNFILSAFVFKDYDTLNYGMDSLRSLTPLTYELHKPLSPDNNFNPGLFFFDRINRRLGEIGLITIDDPRAPIKVIYTLYSIGLDCIYQDLDDFASLPSLYLRRMGVKAAQKGITDILTAPEYGIIGRLMSLGKQSIAKGMETTSNSAGYSLAEIGMEGARKNQEDIVNQAAGWLGILADKAISNDINIASSFATFLGDIGRETIERRLETAARHVATSLAKLGEAATEKRLDEISQEVISILMFMGLRATEKNLELPLESITRCLERIGMKSIECSHKKSFQTTVETLNKISRESTRWGLMRIHFRAKQLLMALGARAEHRGNHEFKEIAAKEIAKA